MKPTTVRTAAALLAGTLFGLGLALSQMVNPAKILNFLDVAGTWDPTLAFVMLGAVAVTIPTFRWVLRQPKPVIDTKFHLPTNDAVDWRLLVGASLFGIGWGLAGFCPGPAIVATLSGFGSVLGFVAMLLIGSLVGSRLGYKLR